MTPNKDLSPYHFMINLALEVSKQTPTSEQEENRRTLFNDIVTTATTTTIDKHLKMIEIDKSLLPLIIETNNIFFYRPLFFPCIFVNTDIPVLEDYTIKGIFTIDENVKETNYNNNWYIISFAINNKTNESTMINMELLSDNKEEEYVNYKGKEASTSPTKIQQIKNEIKNILCNIVDFVEHNKHDISQTIIKTSIDENNKKMSRGKLPMPTKIFIRPSKSFKKYVDDFNKKRESLGKLSYQFVVRGHFRHYQAEQFSSKTKQAPIWIKPFMKGEGIIISKPFVLKS